MKAFYPIEYKLNYIDNLITKFNRIMIFRCNICGTFSRYKLNRNLIKNPEIELREHIRCRKCGGSNRNRQVAKVISHQYNKGILKNIDKELYIYNTESNGALHSVLNSSQNYYSSEYLGNYESGEIINGIIHQDIMATSYRNDFFDLVISSDVLEHVPEPVKAFKEIYRVLKPGGAHVFTVPFYQERASGETRCYIDGKGEIVHLKEPWYHHDPIREEGALVYNVFSIDLLKTLEEIGFSTKLYKLHSALNGIIGQNTLVLCSQK